MLLNSFRIKSFRSIIDTDWINLSLDNVTAVVGQNESGKTAILEALSKTFSSKSAEIDDLRFGDSLPEIWIKTSISEGDVSTALETIEHEVIRDAIKQSFDKNRKTITWYFPTNADSNNALTTDFQITSPDLRSALKDKIEQIKNAVYPEPVATDPPSTDSTPGPDDQKEQAVKLENLLEDSIDEFTKRLFDLSPSFVLFQEESGLLPNKIDITDNFELDKAQGKQAAENFLSIANINLKSLVQSDTRTRAGILKKANKNFTDEFLKFWSQTIGKSITLQIECSIEQYPVESEKLGKPYLEFLITDSSAPLYPKQRSRGTRWFISFFLQLLASQVLKRNRVFLLDEPGANLHEKAQKDVLELIEKIRETSGVIYSTHSPHLISNEYIHRILAVERDPNHSENPTKVIGAHQLGAASTDTLSPILSTMGVALSRQTAIKQHNNVILEELSCYYYLKSFWKLTNETQEANFLPATGTSNVTIFAQLFLGWGLDFLIALDDESSGRKVFNGLKRDMFLDDHDWASKRIYKIKDCDGIEDIFSHEDYKKYIIHNPSATIPEKNSKWAKNNGAAKAIHALKFLQLVEKGEIKVGSLEEQTQLNIKNLVNEIVLRLQNYASTP